MGNGVAASSIDMTNTKELVIESEVGCKGVVEVCAHHSLADVRVLILEDFDEDMLPARDFYFELNGIRLSSKQETRKKAWDLVNHQPICIKAKKRALPQPSGGEQERQGSAPKKAKISEDSTTRSVSGEVQENKIEGTVQRDTEQTNVAAKIVSPTINVAAKQPPSTVDDESNVTDKEAPLVDPRTTKEGTQSPAASTLGKRGIANEPTKTSDIAERDTDFPMNGDHADASKEGNAASLGPKTTSAGPQTNFMSEEGSSSPLNFDSDAASKPKDVSVSNKSNTGNSSKADKAITIHSAERTSSKSSITLAASKEKGAVPMGIEIGAAEPSSCDRNNDELNTLNEQNDAHKIHDRALKKSNAAEHTSREGNNDELITLNEENDAHKIHDQALKKSCSVLRAIKDMIEQNPLFCSENRRKEWTQEISASLAKSAPNTIIGVLGNTGVGKSSLLNALLDEAAVLPTSGSRGCTAAVVELRFNKDLLKPNNDTPVYKGQVEFITLSEWNRELKILVGECSTQEEKTIYARPPDEQRQPDAAAAWSKINQVYGHGTMERYQGARASIVFQRLSTDRRVMNLLTPKPGNRNIYNSIIVQEGQVEPANARALLGSFTSMNGRMRRAKKRWAKGFRSKINDYVYRKGNGNEPQTWPLIRKVVLHGPWVDLSTGACLVDLPGVRDSNAARAKVSEHYLQNCNKIWVVAPIKRAVDDGTAKELMGETFRRRLLMDGNYACVSFICTQTDDCEVAEIMRDHQDVAMKKPGRWELMTELLDQITAIDKEQAELIQEEDLLEVGYDEAEKAVKGSKDELDEVLGETAKKDSTDDVDVDLLQELRVTVDARSGAANQALLQLKSWKEANKEKLERMVDQSHKVQRRLKSICASVRNEYSTACLQEDFRSGLKELLRKPEDDEDEGRAANAPSTLLPENFQMAVHCISANDYLKIQGIKPPSDGPPSCFSKADDTCIPALRSFVHETTAEYRVTFAENFVNSTSDMLDRVKLFAADASGATSGRSARRLQAIFESEMKKLECKIRPVVDEFLRKADEKVKFSLEPSLKAGAAKGNSAAMATVTSWGSKNRRTKQERSAHKNGLWYATYQATVRRDGVYTSGSAGEVDFNQELCDPMEKEFSADWQQIMDSAIRTFLTECETKVLALCAAVDKALVLSFAQEGMDRARLTTMANAATRTCTTALKTTFASMRQIAASKQRDLNRSLLPTVQERMKQGYADTMCVPGGSGKFQRMKNAMESHTRGVVGEMYGALTIELMKGIGELVRQLSSMITATVQVIAKNLESVYSVCWDDQTDKAALMDPILQQKVRECRDKLLPDLNRLRESQDEALQLLGIEREEMELDVMGVDNWEERNAKKMEEAKEKGNFFDLVDDSSDDEMDSRKPPAAKTAFAFKTKVKAEPGTKRPLAKKTNAIPPHSKP